MIVGYIAFYSFGALLVFSGIGAAVLAHALRMRIITPIAGMFAIVGALLIYFVATLGPVEFLKLTGVL